MGCVVNSIESMHVFARPGTGVSPGKIADTALPLFFLIAAGPAYAVEMHHDATRDLMELALHQQKAAPTIHMLGNAPFGSAVAAIHGKTIKREAVVVNFCIEGKKVKFEIHTDAAERAGLRINSNLLKLGKIVPP